MKVCHKKRPADSRISNEIIILTEELTSKWFTHNVPEDTQRDLYFQDVYYIKKCGRVESFLIYTGWDGSLYITLFGTRESSQNKGYGKTLLTALEKEAARKKYSQIYTLTVPPEKKESYRRTLDFYLKNGFTVKKEYKELWESGAILLSKKI